MKYGLIIILTILAFPSLGQEIDQIVFTYQQVDEPGTRQGQPKYSIEFKRFASDELSASSYYKDKTRRKLNSKVTIDKVRIEKVMEWNGQNKRTFTQSDLGLDSTTLRTHTSNYQLNFDLPTNLIIAVDSFQFCQTYKLSKTISTGGETLTVTLIYKEGQRKEFTFGSNDIGGGNFSLRDYILCYTLLSDKIPNDVPGNTFFSKRKFTDIVYYYQKTVECEGYYYKEFTDKNPTMPSKDRRMMTGWNFVEYMERRSKRE